MHNLARLLWISALAIFGAVGAPIATHAVSDAPVIVGLDADMSSGAAVGGRSIRRGAEVAIREINAKGGVLGRKLKLVVRDHRGNPARGKDNILEFAATPNVVAVLGGIHTPVALQELKAIHANKLIYLGPWAAGTPVVDNGYEPNYVFRVSVRDAFAGGFLVDHAVEAGYKKLGLLFERTGWGRSNEKAVNNALSDKGMEPVGLQWFNWGVADLSDKIERLSAQGAEAILLVANAREGGMSVRSMAARDENNRLPIISHWGISGGNFFADNRKDLKKIDFTFLQTFSFLKPPIPERAEMFFKALHAFDPKIEVASDVSAPVGAAHAYDLMHLLAKAIVKAGTIERANVRDALETLKFHAGLMKDYSPPFTKTRHDALDASSFIMVRFDENGVIRPVEAK
ncbi:MAG: ABC transporter substrate-binding protein [Rhodospirillaceae bacterium]|nr:ABC transporter substrate-binding protein [Rhodospirillaceae bacterium]|tara:strand:+ start:519 stop:1718 length:1200 start_codon:yes stop_codon:yes gene_type:complete